MAPDVNSGCIAAYYLQPVLHIIPALGITERSDAPKYRYPLSELPQTRRVQFCRKLRLAAKHNCRSFLVRVSRFERRRICSSSLVRLFFSGCAGLRCRYAHR